jgi:hypothetical protein
VLKVRFFQTDPFCELSEYYAQMIPILDKKYDIEIEIILKKAAEYLTDEYFELGLPMAAAVMVDEEIVAEGDKVSQYTVESVICRHLGVAAPKLDRAALYQLCLAVLIWMSRRKRRWKARNLGKNNGKLSLLRSEQSHEIKEGEKAVEKELAFGRNPAFEAAETRSIQE